MIQVKIEYGNCIDHIIFNLNEKEYIKIESDNEINTLYPCDEVVVKFFQENNKYTLDIDCIKEEIGSLYDSLCCAINNEAPLHSSIKHGIGYLWNEEMQNKSGLSYMKVSGIDYWVGLQNLVWSTPSNIKPNLSTWLYNNSQGNIILEITPSYPWHYREPDIDFISYDEWIKTYEPIAIYTIQNDIAVAWKDQAKMILDRLDENIKKAS